MLTDRGVKVLWLVYAYAKQHGAWPSSADVAKRLGRDKMNAYRLLLSLQANGFVRLHDAGPESGWRLSPQALAVLKRPPPRIHGTAPRRVRNDPKRLAWYTRRKRLAERYSTVRLFDGLPVVEA